MGPLSLTISCFAQVLLAVPLDGRPTRLGVALPKSALARGLRLDGRGALQWRRLPVAGAAADPVWVELALVGPRGIARVLAGGDGPCEDGCGPVLTRHREERATAEGVQTIERWLWRTGEVDERVRTRCLVATTGGDERSAVGEADTACTDDFASRAHAWCRMAPAAMVACGAMPARGAGGAVAADVRERLRATLPALPELPGPRGRGDYARSGGVVTNLEFDTTLALLRCGLGLGEPRAFAAAQRAARHLVDHDLDMRTGLPFSHGVDHRSSEPEPGHAWLQGLLWTGLLTADDDLLAAARTLGDALGQHPPRGEGRRDRMRDHGWPLRELEALLAICPDAALARAADRIARGIADRWDPDRRAFRFGEAATDDGGWLERGWLGAGLLLPALRAHLRRRPDRAFAAIVDDYAEALRARLLAPGDGVPTHWRLGAQGDAFAEHRDAGTAAACFALDGLPPDDLERALRRSTVRRAVRDTPAVDHPDLATEFTIAARCDWVWR